MLALINNIGSFLTSAFCGAVAATAAGAGDASAVTGCDIDRTGANSGKLIIGYKAVLAATKTLSIAAELQESADGSSWDTAEALQASTMAATGGEGGSTEIGTVEFDIDLRGRKKHIRFNFTPDLNASGTDTALVSAIFVANGEAIPPAGLTVTLS